MSEQTSTPTAFEQRLALEVEKMKDVVFTDYFDLAFPESPAERALRERRVASLVSVNEQVLAERFLASVIR